MSIADQLEQHLRDDIARRLEPVRQEIEDQTKQAASERTGNLRAGIHCDTWVDAGSRFETVIHSDADYSQYEDEGSGIYGPTGERITATGGGVLRFDWPAAGGVVFFWSVAGSPGKHFFAEALPQRVADAFIGLF